MRRRRRRLGVQILTLRDSGCLRLPRFRRERATAQRAGKEKLGWKMSSAGEGKGRGERETDLGFAETIQRERFGLSSSLAATSSTAKSGQNSTSSAGLLLSGQASGLLLHQAHPFPSREARYISSSFLLVSFLSALFCFCGCRGAGEGNGTVRWWWAAGGEGFAAGGKGLRLL